LSGRSRRRLDELNARCADWSHEINIAWLDGEIAGFPDEAEFAAAFTWMCTAWHEEEEAFRRVFAESDARGEIPGLDELIVRLSVRRSGGDEGSL
jgi:hypothetical protein